jgi:hypothetical protein
LDQQAVLDRYAELAETGGAFSEVLTGSALLRAQASQTLIQGLGYSQRGRARFEIWTRSESAVSGCLDTSDVELIDQRGEFSTPTRRRTPFSASIGMENLTSEFEVEEARR